MSHVRIRLAHAVLAAALLLCAASGGVRAQTTGSIRGMVVESATNRPVPRIDPVVCARRLPPAATSSTTAITIACASLIRT